MDSVGKGVDQSQKTLQEKNGDVAGFGLPENTSLETEIQIF
jgi:hypothetical protein